MTLFTLKRLRECSAKMGKSRRLKQIKKKVYDAHNVDQAIVYILGTSIEEFAKVDGFGGNPQDE